MCGHVGIAGKLALKDEAMMRRLFLMDYFRGTESTGLAALRGKEDIYIAKIASHPLDLFDSQRFKTALNGGSSRVFLGHNRAATRGSVNAFNAHPYQVDHIIGAHNGTLEVGTVNDLEKELGEKFSTDSLAMFTSIARRGLKATVEMCRGAWSLVWIDTKLNTLNFIRNKERPMWLSFNEDFDRLIWASEYPMIKAAIDLGTPNDYKMFKSDEGFTYFATEENTHYSFDIDVLVAGGKERPKPIVRKIEGKPAVVYSNPTSYHNPNKNKGSAGEANAYDPFERRGPAHAGFGANINVSGSGNTGTNSQKPGTPSTTHSKITSLNSGKTISSPEPEVVQLDATMDEPYAGFITKERFEELAKHGCSWCSRDIDYGDLGITIFDKEDVIYCEDHSAGGKGNSSTRLVLRHIFMPQASANLPMIV